MHVRCGPTVSLARMAFPCPSVTLQNSYSHISIAHLLGWVSPLNNYLNFNILFLNRIFHNILHFLHQKHKKKISWVFFVFLFFFPSCLKINIIHVGICYSSITVNNKGKEGIGFSKEVSIYRLWLLQKCNYILKGINMAKVFLVEFYFL